MGLNLYTRREIRFYLSIGLKKEANKWTEWMVGKDKQSRNSADAL
jgi:hypothetical protein